MKTNPLVMVYWDDAWANATLHYNGETDYNALHCIDVGWLVNENEHGITICGACNQDYSNFRAEKFTPWGMVTKIEYVEFDS